MYAFFLVHFRLAAQIFHKLIFGITRMLMTYLFMSLFINYCLQFSSIFLKMERSMLNSCNFLTTASLPEIYFFIYLFRTRNILPTTTLFLLMLIIHTNYDRYWRFIYLVFFLLLLKLRIRPICRICPIKRKYPLKVWWQRVYFK